MQKRHLGLLVVVALGVALGYWWMRRSANTRLPSTAAIATPSTPSVSPAATPVPAAPVRPGTVPPTQIDGVPSKQVVATPVGAAQLPARPDAAIEDRKTIDFSGGKAVVKDSAEDKAIMDASVKEMEEATKNITFEPLPAQPKKK